MDSILVYSITLATRQRMDSPSTVGHRFAPWPDF